MLVVVGCSSFSLLLLGHVVDQCRVLRACLGIVIHLVVNRNA